MSHITITAQVEGATSVRLVASKSQYLVSPVYSEYASVNSYGFARLSLSGLDAESLYYLAIEDQDGGQLGDSTFEVTTPAAGAHDFTFGCASCCYDGYDPLVFDNLRARAESGAMDFFIHMGDLHYQDITDNSEAAFQAAYDSVFARPKYASLFASLPVYYTWDDHDYGPNGANGNSPGREAAIAAYRSRVPSPALGAATGATYYSFVRGRVRFVVSDTRSERETQGAYSTSDPQQTMFSDTQLTWFFNELSAAKSAGQAIVWVTSVPWVTGVGDGWDDWGGYDAQRQEIVDYLNDNALTGRIVTLSGDMHALAWDDGTGTSNQGGFPAIQAAPLFNTMSSKGGPYSIGPIPASDNGAEISQFGLVSVTDNGGTALTFRFQGIQVDTSTGAETVAIDETFQLTVGDTTTAIFGNGETGGMYDPADLTTMFQDAAGTVPVTAAGDPVALWLDISGNGYHLSVDDTTARPTYQTDGTRHWLEFDGVQTYLHRMHGETHQTSPISIFIGLNDTGDVIENYPVYSQGNTESVTPYLTLQTYWEVEGKEQLSAYARNTTDGDVIPDPQAGVAFDGNDHLVGMEFDDTGSDYYVDGAFTLHLDNGATTDTPVNVSCLGARERVTIEKFWGGRIYGLVVVEARTGAAQRDLIHQFLADRAGVTQA